MVLTLILGRSERSTLFFSCLSSWEKSVAHWVVFWVAFRASLGCCENKHLFAWNQILVTESVASHFTDSSLGCHVRACVCV